jgi:hypothetical protein
LDRNMIAVLNFRIRQKKRQIESFKQDYEWESYEDEAKKKREAEAHSSRATA